MLLEHAIREGENPVFNWIFVYSVHCRRVAYFGIGALTGGNILPKLNIVVRPIANKYCEGKMKRTLKRGLKVCEIAKWEANGTCS